jgi:succinate dehydrogenase / fumarate reductase iron-sulfur subunit
MMDVELRIQRFDPETDQAPHWQSFTVPVEPMDRVLDVLTRAKERFDGSITFRRSCAHGVCGSDALMINGRNRLACKLRVEQLGRTITVAPLPGLPVVKDLVVDMEGFFGKYRSVMPFLVAAEPEGVASAFSLRSSVRSTTIRRSASCAPPAPPPARASGLSLNMLDRRPL